MSRREREDPRIVRTRQLIVRAFQELLGEKDFEALTIQEIADRATINRVTFYAHFEDKYVLLEAAFNQSFASELCAIVSPSAEFNRSNLQLLIETVCVFLKKGYAHCAEAWQNDTLVGGLYGIRMGKVFFGESMFSLVSNASKFAFISYVWQLLTEGVALVDCQVYTRHLQSLGARMVSRKLFLDLLKTYIR